MEGTAVIDHGGAVPSARKPAPSVASTLATCGCRERRRTAGLILILSRSASACPVRPAQPVFLLPSCLPRRLNAPPRQLLPLFESPPADAPPTGPIGLVLTGGGARAAYQAGALLGIRQILLRAGWPPQVNPFRIIAGTSAGALNATAIAAGADDMFGAIMRLNALWGAVEPGQIYRSDVAGAVGNAMHWLGNLGLGWLVRQAPRAMFDNSPLESLLLRTIDFERLRQNLREGHFDSLAVEASSYTSGHHITFYQSREPLPPWVRSRRLAYPTIIDVRHLMASAALPFLFPAIAVPVEGEDEYCGDGSMRQMAPTSPAVHLGADRILVIGAAQLPAAVAAPGAGAGSGVPTIADPVEGSAALQPTVERRRKKERRRRARPTPDRRDNATFLADLEALGNTEALADVEVADDDAIGHGSDGSTGREPGLAGSAYPSLAQIGSHVLASIFFDALASDLERIQRINRTLALMPPEVRARSSLRVIDTLVIAPSRPLDHLARAQFDHLPATVRALLRVTGASRSGGAGIASYLLFDRSYTRRLIALGRRDALDQAERIRAFFGTP